MLARCGSPPRAWGQRFRGQGGGRVGRFTPTRVGTTASGGTHAASNRGSPPRAWGQHGEGAGFRLARRFTPTRVGTTSFSFVKRTRRTVHPHARGDNS